MIEPLADNSILVIDDNPDDFFAVQRALTRAGMANPLLHCESGREGLEFLDNAALHGTLPSLVLLDINMPGMKGDEVLRAIRDTPELRTLPVLMLTSSDDDRDVLAAFQGGASAYLAKPLEFEDLLRAIQRVKSHCFELVLRPRGGGAVG